MTKRKDKKSDRPSSYRGNAPSAGKVKFVSVSWASEQSAQLFGFIGSWAIFQYLWLFNITVRMLYRCAVPRVQHLDRYLSRTKDGTYNHLSFPAAIVMCYWHKGGGGLLISVSIHRPQVLSVFVLIVGITKQFLVLYKSDTQFTVQVSWQ